MGIEFKILDLIQELHTPVGDIIMPLITRLGDKGIVWIVLTVIFLLVPKTRKIGTILTVALCVDFILCNGILKNLFARIRPCDVNNSVQLLIARPDDFSFPSGHTAASFTVVAALFFAGEKNLWKSTLPVAILIAFSRLYMYVHYPTDILGGIAVGIISGYAGCRIIGKIGTDIHQKNSNNL